MQIAKKASTKFQILLYEKDSRKIKLRLVKRLGFFTGGWDREEEQEEHREFQDSANTLYDTTVTDTCCYTHVQTHRCTTLSAQK